MFKRFFLILRELQSIHHNLIAFHEFGSGETHRNLSPLGMILDEVHDAVQTTVDGSLVVVFIAKVLTDRRFLVFGHVDGMIHQLGHAFVP